MNVIAFSQQKEENSLTRCFGSFKTRQVFIRAVAMVTCIKLSCRVLASRLFIPSCITAVHGFVTSGQVPSLSLLTIPHAWFIYAHYNELYAVNNCIGKEKRTQRNDRHIIALRLGAHNKTQNVSQCNEIRF